MPRHAYWHWPAQEQRLSPEQINHNLDVYLSRPRLVVPPGARILYAPEYQPILPSYMEDRYTECE